MSLQHIQKNSLGLLHIPIKFEKNLPNGHRVMRKRKCGAHGAGGARYPPIYKQASRKGRVMRIAKIKSAYNLLIHVPRGLQCHTDILEIMG